MSQSANGAQALPVSGFIGQGAFSHNVANRETFQGTPLLKAGVQLVKNKTNEHIEGLLLVITIQSYNCLLFSGSV